MEQLGCGGAQVSAYFRVDSGAFRFLLPPLLAANQFVFGCFLQRDAVGALSFVSPNRLGRYSQASKQFAKAVEEVAAVVASVRFCTLLNAVVCVLEKLISAGHARDRHT